MSGANTQLSAADQRALLQQLLAGTSPPRPLSFAQERLFFIETLQPGTALYNIPSYLPITAPIDAEVLDRTLQELARRHQILRTRFLLADGRPLQQVVGTAEITLDVHDLRGLPDRAQQDELLRLARYNRETPFDLSKAPLLRVCLARCDGNRSHLFWCVHHICSDAWSARVFVTELTQIYEAFARRAPSPLAAPVWQYADYAQWQRAQLSGPRLQESLAYWRDRLAGAPTVVRLPADRAPPTTATYAGGMVTEQVGTEVRSALQALAKQERVTLFMILHAAFATLIHRLSEQDDMVIGSPVANRARPESQGLIGLLVNTLVLRTRINDDPTFRDLLRQVRESTLADYEHQELPFERLVQELQPQRSRAHNPLFQLMLVLQDHAQPADAGGAAAPSSGEEWLPRGNGLSKFDLTVFAASVERGIEFGWEFSRDLYETETISGFARMFCSLLGQMATRPDDRLSQFSLLDAPARERWRRLTQGPAVTVPHPTVVELFRARAQTSPELAAVIAPDRTLTYGQMDELSDRIASSVVDAQEGNDPVGVLLPRGWRALAAILGVLKAGRPYLPLDPSYPVARLGYMVENSGTTLVLTSGECPVPGLTVLEFDVALSSAPLTGPVAAPSSLAYVMYTSGSSGQPKGVMMPHTALSNLIHWQIGSEEGRARKTLQFAPLSFDVSFQEIFSTWLSGGTLVSPAEAPRVDFKALWDMIVSQEVQRLFLPAVALQALTEAAVGQERNARLELIITAGEQLHVTPGIVELLRRLGGELRNQYGPTETHVVSEQILRGDPRHWPARPGIGRPINNCSIAIVDRHGHPTPVGVPGELLVGGVAVAAGYWNAPEPTAVAFGPHPALPDHATVYRTGDRGRFLPDGSIEFLGRRDEQVKIRGFRAEPAEVVTALLRHPDITEAAVIPETARSGGQRLVAYVTLRPDVTVPDAVILREWCSRSLPEYLVPSRFRVLDALPRTPSGKIALRALPQDVEDNPASPTGQHDSLLSPVELEVMEIVAALLDIHPVSVNDDFFALGGHSLLAMRLIAQVRARFGVELPMSRVFDRPILGHLAADITEQMSHASDTTESLLARIESMSEQEVATQMESPT